MKNNQKKSLAVQPGARRELQRRNIVLIPSTRSVRLWAPNTRVPGQLRRVVYANRREVLRLIDRSETIVCCSPALHSGMGAWKWILCRQACEICAALRPWVTGKAQKQVESENRKVS
jgi:hypothetical protein